MTVFIEHHTAEVPATRWRWEGRAMGLVEGICEKPRIRRDRLAQRAPGCFTGRRWEPACFGSGHCLQSRISHEMPL